MSVNEFSDMASEAQTAQGRLTNETGDKKLEPLVTQLTRWENDLRKDREELQAGDSKELMPQIDKRVPQQYQ